LKVDLSNSVMVRHVPRNDVGQFARLAFYDFTCAGRKATYH